MAVMNKKWTEADVIADAIEGMSLRDAAEWLNELIPQSPELGMRRSHASIHNWVNNIYRMDAEFADTLTMFYPEDDPRHQLGRNIKQLRFEAMRRVARQP